MSGKKILITGPTGMLGSILLEALPESIGLRRELNILKSEKLHEELEKIAPDIIIHTAAFTNVELCETQKDEAYKINVLGTQNLVNYCTNRDTLFVYISSTGIYGTQNAHEPYNEFDAVYPTTVHHQSKYEGEKAVINHLNRYLIIRTGWLYGGDKTHAKNFVYKRYLEASNKDVIYSNNSQIGNPTSVYELVEQIKTLIQSSQYGVFNCVNSAKNISRYDYVKKIIELFELDCTVSIAEKGMFERVAPVSHNESAQNYKLDLLNLNVMGAWDDALSQYINQLKSEI